MPVCHLCPNRFFNDENALQAHQESKHHSCGTCNKVLKSQQALEQHIRDKHTSFECNYCDREFTTEQGRDAHEDAKHTNFECNYCNRTFSSEEARQQHENTKHTHTFECNYCNRTFNSEEARQQHENTKHTFECRHCDRNFNSEEARQQHEDTKHTFQCRHCVCVFFSENAREQHEDDVHSFECRYCDRTFNTEEAREQHEDAKHTSFGCHHCDREFSSDEARQQHESAKHLQKFWQHQRATPQFKCDHCGTMHFNSSLKILHEASCASNPDNQVASSTSTFSIQPASPSSSGPQSAEIIREGPSPSMAAQDTDMESDPPASSSHSSQDEGEMFHSTSTLPSTDAIGVEVAFQPPPACAHSLDPLRCFLCRSSGASKRETDDADSIVSITRSDDPMDCSNVAFLCTPCLKVFETEQALRDHVCAFRAAMPRPHCPVCYTQFDDGESLHEHLERLEAFSCQLCLTRCCSDEMLQDHLLSHPTCSKCGKSFADDIARCAHVESEHPVVVCWDCGGIVVDNSLEFHYTESSAHPSCAFCGVGMRNSAEMDEHVGQVHATDAEMNHEPGGGEVDAGSVSPAVTVPPPETSQPEEAERPPVEKDEPAPSSSGVDTLCDESHGTPLQTESTLYSSPPPSVLPQVELVEPAGDTSVVDGEEVERQFGSPSPTPAEHGSDASRLFHASKATVTTTTNDTRPPSPVSSVSASAGSLSDLSTRTTSSSASESVVFVSAEGIPDYVRENRAVLVATSAGSPSSAGRTPLRLSSESSLASLAREAGLGPGSRPVADEAARKASLHCRICLRDPCENPTATICGHLFCKRCITRAVVARSECPVCESATLLYCLFKLDLSV